MRKATSIFLFLAFLQACAGPGDRKNTAPEPDPYTELAGKLSPAGGASRPKTAVIAFSAPGGSVGQEGALVAERLLTRLASIGCFELVERGLLEKIMEEHKLQASGTVSQVSERRLGRLLGVELVVSGTLSRRRDGSAELNARVIDVESGSVRAAGNAVVPADWISTYIPRSAAPAPARVSRLSAPAHASLYRPAGNEFSLAGPDRIYLLSEEKHPDFEASIEVKFTQKFSAAGLIFRSGTPGSFYQYEWYTEGDNVCATELGLMHGYENKWNRLAEPIKKVPELDRWYEMRVRVKSGRIECYLDRKRVFSVEDSRYPKPGRTGLRIWLTNAVSFRNFRIKEI